MPDETHDTLVTLLGPQGEVEGTYPVTWGPSYPDVVQRGPRYYVRSNGAGVSQTPGTYRRATLGVIPLGSLTRVHVQGVHVVPASPVADKRQDGPE
jgi:hypothetical protein